MKLILKRWPSQEHGTFGAWCDDEGYPFMPSLERPWADNEPFVSCIPAGTYLYKRVPTNMQSVHKAGYSETFEVQGVPGRTLIRVHPANWAHELQGCMATGSAYGYINDTPAIESSRDAFQEWMERLDGIDEFELEIINMIPASFLPPIEEIFPEKINPKEEKKPWIQGLLQALLRLMRSSS